MSVVNIFLFDASGENDGVNNVVSFLKVIILAGFGCSKWMNVGVWLPG